MGALQRWGWPKAPLGSCLYEAGLPASLISPSLLLYFVDQEVSLNIRWKWGKLTRYTMSKERQTWNHTLATLSSPPSASTRSMLDFEVNSVNTHRQSTDYLLLSHWEDAGERFNFVLSPSCLAHTEAWLDFVSADMIDSRSLTAAVHSRNCNEWHNVKCMTFLSWVVLCIFMSNRHHFHVQTRAPKC